MTRALLLVTLGLLTACSHSPSVLVPALPSLLPSDALYEPPVSSAFEILEFTVVDADRVGGARAIPIAVRVPTDVEGPRPVVVWSHGGGDGKTNPLRSGPAWGDALAEAGYVVASVAITPRPRGQVRALCRHVGYSSRDACRANFRSVKYDRQHDLSAVIDWVEEMSTDPAWADRIDPSRIVVGGHSAGSGGAAELAGAVRSHGPDDMDSRMDPRPVAFLLLALQGVDEQKGFAEGAWDAIGRPVFGATGLGDVTENMVPEERVRVFDSLDSNGSRLLWVEDEASAHTLFNLETAGCERRGGSAQHCRQLVDIIETSAIAFLDAHVRGLPEAHAWLAQTDLPTATDGLARWWAVR